MAFVRPRLQPPLNNIVKKAAPPVHLATSRERSFAYDSATSKQGDVCPLGPYLVVVVVASRFVVVDENIIGCHESRDKDGYRSRPYQHLQDIGGD